MNFNIMGIGLPQLIIIFGLSLVLFGPKKMVQYAYQAGQFITQMRKMWEEAAKNVQKEFHDAGLDLPTDLPMRGGRLDIGAAAMRIVQQAPNPATAESASTGSAAAEIASLDGSTIVATTIMAAPNPAPTLNYPPEPDSSAPTDGQNKKYDAWLPE